VSLDHHNGAGPSDCGGPDATDDAEPNQSADPTTDSPNRTHPTPALPPIDYDQTKSWPERVEIFTQAEAAVAAGVKFGPDSGENTRLILERVRAPKRPRTQQSSANGAAPPEIERTTTAPQAGDGPPDSYFLNPLREEADEVARTANGRNHRTFVAARNLGELMGPSRGLLTPQIITDALMDAGRLASPLGDHPFPDDEIAKAIEQGLNYGSATPRRIEVRDDGSVIEVAPGALGGGGGEAESASGSTSEELKDDGRAAQRWLEYYLQCQGWARPEEVMAEGGAAGYSSAAIGRAFERAGVVVKDLSIPSAAPPTAHWALPESYFWWLKGQDFTVAPARPAADVAEVAPAEPAPPVYADRVLTRSALLTLPDPEPLIVDTLDRGTVAVLYGKWGTGKSLIAQDWGLSVGTGRNWQGRAVRRGRVLYVAGEGAFGLKGRVHAWEVGWGTEISDGDFAILPFAVNLTRPLEVANLAALIAWGGYDFVILDTLARCMVGADENSAKDCGVVVDSMARLLNHTPGGRGCVLGVHHAGKDGKTLRGSSAFEGAADTVYFTAKDGGLITLDREKRKDGPEGDHHDLKIDLIPGTPSAVISAQNLSTLGVDRLVDRSDRGQRLLSTFVHHFSHIGASKAELRKVADMPDATFFRAVSDLLQSGDLINTGTDKRPFYMTTGK
jgi:hypothetical protein